MFYSALVAIRTTWNYKVKAKRDSSTAHTTAGPYHSIPSRSICGLLDHASMFDDRSDCVQGERLWTISGRWKRGLEAKTKRGNPL